MSGKTNEQILHDAKLSAQWGTAAGILGAVTSLYSGIAGYQTAKRYGRMQQRAAEAQARLNELATERNIAAQTRVAAQQISNVQRQGRQVLGSQLAVNAAMGGSTASGSMQALLRSTGYSVGRDVSTIQANLINSAAEMRRQTTIENLGLQYQGQMAQYSARGQAFNQFATGVSGMLSSASSVAAKWARYDDLTMLNRAQNATINTPKGSQVLSGLSTGLKTDFQYYTIGNLIQLN